MEIRAYNELYLSDAMRILAEAFDYAINDCDLDSDFFIKAFILSNHAKMFETGIPDIVGGISGEELAVRVIKSVFMEYEFPKKKLSFAKSREYWAGYYLAYYQWYTCKRFKDIQMKITLSEIISMYNPYHEMDVMSFVEEMEHRFLSRNVECNLRKMRESRNLTQRELSNISGVKLRSIQLYEQRVNDINKAQVSTIYRLAWTLGCAIEDLLEDPFCEKE